MEYIEFGYAGLFLICFLAATILPLTSEGVLVVFLIGGFDPWICLLTASIGNVIGGTTNYLLGLIWNPEKLKKRLGSPQRFERAEKLSQQHGYWLGLISWMPIIGDPLIIVLGYLRTPLVPLILTMSIAKTARYALIIFFWVE